MEYKNLPNSELELMMILWKRKEPMTRVEIEEQLPKERKLSKTTVLSFLARLEEKGFVRIKKQGRSNCYIPVVEEQEYLEQAGSTMLKKLYDNSVKKFVASLYDGKELSGVQIRELRAYLDSLEKGE